MFDRERTIDCLVCGLATVDIVAWPIPLDQPIASSGLVRAERIETTTGGLVSNSGIALERLGAHAAALASVGNDLNGQFVRQRLVQERLDVDALQNFPGGRTSTTLVLVSAACERSFVFDQGVAGLLDVKRVRAWRHLLSRSKYFLFGYFGLLPHWDDELPDMLAFARAKGCITALDAAGNGGQWDLLARVLPHLDIYVPSLYEARQQTGATEPREMIDRYRQAGAAGMVGIKLGAQGALLSPGAGNVLEVAPVTPPGPVIDTTGAGDAFYAGLIAGLARGMTVAQAGRLAAAAGACCVTGVGATAGLRGFAETMALAGS